MTIRFGILPYDTTDSSVIFRCPLTSLASITGIGGTDRSSGNNVFDSVLGMSPRRNGSNISGVSFADGSVTVESGDLGNLPCGQLSIEVERVAIAVPAAGGYTAADNQVLLTHGPVGGGNGDIGYVYKNVTGHGLQTKSGDTGTVVSNKYLGAQSNRSRFALLTLSWTPERCDYYIDGLYRWSSARSLLTQPLDQFALITLGNYNLGAGISNWNMPYYMRNLIVSARPVVQHRHPVLANVFSVGDSFAGGQPLNHTNGAAGDCNEINIIGERLGIAGFKWGSVAVYSNGGGTVEDGTADDIETDINGSGMTRAAGAALFPTFIIVQMGVNDAGGALSTFLADLKDHVKEWMADGTTYTANYRGKRMILVCHVAGVSGSGVLTMNTDLAAVHALIKQIPDWWDATYPSRAGQVQVLDMVPLMTTDGITMNSAYWDLSDEVHPNSTGDVAIGNAIADKMLLMLEV